MNLILQIAVLLFAAHRAWFPLSELDLFFHLKLGDLIRAEHAIPFRNLFSFTYPDHPDLDLSWAFQVLVSWLYQRGGFAALVLLKIVAFTLAIALAHRAARRLGAHPIAAATAAVLAVCASDQRLVERPHLVTFVGIGVMLLLLARAERDARTQWFIPLIIAVWANFHAGVFLGVMLLAAHVATRDRSRRGIAILILGAVAMFATPTGMMLPRYLLWHTGLGSTRNVEEFRRADFYDDPWFFVLLAICAIGGFSKKRVARVPVLVFVALLAWRSVRFVAEWSILSLPFVALTLDELKLRARGFVVASAVGLLLLTGVERRARGFSLGLDPEAVPFDAIDFATREGLRERLYHDLDVGCYLLWEGWPRYRVFQDARLPAYPDEFHRALDETSLAPDAFDAFLARYGVDAALLTTPDINMRMGSFDPERWALVYRTTDAVILARRTARHAALIARAEIPLRFRFRFVGGASIEPLWSQPAGVTIDRCEWNRRLVAALVEESRPDLAVRARRLGGEECDRENALPSTPQLQK